jgi:hypothetical protein
MLEQARVLSEAGRVQAAEDLLRRALDDRPADHDLLVALARVLTWQGELVEAEDLLDRALEGAPTSVEALALRAVLLARAGEPGRAREALAEMRRRGVADDAADGAELQVLHEQGWRWRARRAARRFEREHGPDEQSRAVLGGERGVDASAMGAVESRPIEPRFDWAAGLALEPHDQATFRLDYAGSSWLGDQEHQWILGVHVRHPAGVSFVVAGGGAWPGRRFGRAQAETGLGIRMPGARVELETGYAFRVYGAATSLLGLGRIVGRLWARERVAIVAGGYLGAVRMGSPPLQQPAPGLSVGVEAFPHERVEVRAGYVLATELFLGPGGRDLALRRLHRVPVSLTVRLGRGLRLGVGWSLEAWEGAAPYHHVELRTAVRF